jgi:hypothetical protein
MKLLRVLHNVRESYLFISVRYTDIRIFSSFNAIYKQTQKYNYQNAGQNNYLTLINSISLKCGNFKIFMKDSNKLKFYSSGN